MKTSYKTLLLLIDLIGTFASLALNFIHILKYHKVKTNRCMKYLQWVI